MTPGRGFTQLNAKGERAAFGAWIKELIQKHGGRAKVAEITGISTDSLTKWMGGRGIPSKVNIQKLIDGEIMPYDTMESMIADSPWMGLRYRRAATATVATTIKPERTQEDQAAPAEPVYVRERMNLMDAVLSEPGLDTQQRAQLAALITMVVTGVDLNIDISPRA